MSRGKTGLFTSVAAVALMFGSTPASADGNLIGAVDNIPPDAPSNVSVGLSPDGSAVDLTWDAPNSDRTAAVTTGGGGANHLGGHVVERDNVVSYRIYRRISPEADFGAFVAEISRGTGEYTELVVTLPLGSNQFYYGVQAWDGTLSSIIVPATGVVQLGEGPSGSTVTYDGEDASRGLIVDLGPTPQGQVITGGAVQVSWGGGGPLTFAINTVGAGFGLVSSSTTYVDAITTPFINSSTFFRLGDTSNSDHAVNASSISFRAIFDPSVVGNFQGGHDGAITFISNDADISPAVELLAQIPDGIQRAAITLSSGSFNFVNVPAGATSSPQTLSLTNSGDLPATLDLALTGDAFSLSTSSVSVPAKGENSVTITFTPADGTEGQQFEETITITSTDDPAPELAVTSVTLNGAAGEVEGTNPVEEEVVEVTVTFTATASEQVYVDGSPANEAFKSNAKKSFARVLGIPEERILITSIVQGSTEVSFRILDPPEDEPDATSAVDVAAALETIIADEPETLVNDLEAETGEELGAADAITTAAVVVVIQPQDSEGNPIAGWFTRTGSQVDFDDFFAFADAFGSSLGDTTFDTLFDISGSNLEPDGQVNFDDFFKFADDFGKTVANATEVQALLGQ